MDVRLIDELSEEQTRELMGLYAGEWWTNDRTLDDVRTMLEATQVIVGLVDPHDQLVGFTRVLTDFHYQAVVLDVIVAPAARGQGLGDVLMGAVIDHPRLQELRRAFTLRCRDSVRPFYERWGFQSTGPVGEVADHGRGSEMRRPVESTVRPDRAAVSRGT